MVTSNIRLIGKMRPCQPVAPQAHPIAGMDWLPSWQRGTAGALESFMGLQRLPPKGDLVIVNIYIYLYIYIYDIYIYISYIYISYIYNILISGWRGGKSDIHKPLFFVGGLLWEGVGGIPMKNEANNDEWMTDWWIDLTCDDWSFLPVGNKEWCETSNQFIDTQIIAQAQPCLNLIFIVLPIFLVKSSSFRVFVSQI